MIINRPARFEFLSACTRALVLVAAAVAGLTAQVPSDGFAPPSDHDCRAAAHTVEHGKPAKKEEWAFTTIVRCPAYVGAAGATAINAMRAETDTAALAAALLPLTNVVDASLMSADLGVVQDATASEPARVFAVIGLISLASSGMVSVPYGELVTNGTNCRAEAASLAATVTAPLPAGYLATIRSALTAVTASSATGGVKNAAACGLVVLPDSP